MTSLFFFSGVSRGHVLSTAIPEQLGRPRRPAAYFKSAVSFSSFFFLSGKFDLRLEVAVVHRSEYSCGCWTFFGILVFCKRVLDAELVFVVTGKFRWLFSEWTWVGLLEPMKKKTSGERWLKIVLLDHKKSLQKSWTELAGLYNERNSQTKEKWEE